ncbi:hypothetical protein B5F76_09015 [Desulfovibrio sp. An276]|uniref:hypothetical protein n=1 Tax=Desulfovibrio sp. An276 TaxID=1965618 RepID=UPI000B37CE92|nr:hypothetical protein [Desulfovibrio sp. An276]OUO51613.1 hypothetical protein B5F76_09015 [Desulfovibrio sp. An276]
MPVYNVTVLPDPLIEQGYRIKADSPEEAKDAATELFYGQLGDMISFTVEGEEAPEGTEAEYDAKDYL